MQSDFCIKCETLSDEVVNVTVTVQMTMAPLRFWAVFTYIIQKFSVVCGNVTVIKFIDCTIDAYYLADLFCTAVCSDGPWYASNISDVIAKYRCR